MQKLINSNSFLWPLSLLFSLIFMWSNNAHMFPAIYFATSLATILLMTTFFFFIGNIIEKLITKTLPKKTNYAAIIKAVIFSLFSNVTVSIFLFSFIIDKNLLLYFFWISFNLTFAIIYFDKVKILNMFLLIMLSFSFIKFAFNLTNVTIDTHNQTKAFAQQSSNFFIPLKQKPNIYLFWLESYHDLDVQKNVYNINTSPIKRILNKYDFNTIDNVYSSGSFTLKTMADTYSFGKHQWSSNYGNSDANPLIRRTIGGSDQNLLFKNFKKNQYYISQFFASYQYSLMFFDKKEKNLDKAGRDFGYNLQTVLSPIFSFAQNKSFNAILKASSRDPILNRSKFQKVIIDEINNAKASKKPSFIVFKGGGNHYKGWGKTFSKDETNKWVADGVYKNLIESSYAETTKIIEHIVANDNNSIIILLGDHGATRYSYINPKANDKEGLIKKLRQENISRQEFADDLFNIFLSIRLPNGKIFDISHGQAINNSNLFLYIFSYINNDLSLLNLQETSISEYFGVPIIKDNKLIL